MSKRSYRRLALVAGAALAVGSMAPAMAARVDSSAGGSATVDLSGLAGSLPSITGLAPIGTVTTVAGTALGIVQGAPTMAQSAVNNVVTTALGLVNGLPVGGNLLSVDAADNANVGVNVLGTGVAVTGVSATAAGLASGVTAVPGAVVGTALQTAGPVVGTAVGTVGTVVGIAQSVPGSVIGTANGLLTGGLGGLGILNILGGSSVSGNTSVSAGLLGSI